MAVQVSAAVPVNQAPTVSAGSDGSVTQPGPLTLNGIVTDDGLDLPNGTLTISWSQTSGPGLVTFGNAAAASTTATFSQPGHLRPVARRQRRRAREQRYRGGDGERSGRQATPRQPAGLRRVRHVRSGGSRRIAVHARSLVPRTWHRTDDEHRHRRRDRRSARRQGQERVRRQQQGHELFPRDRRGPSPCRRFRGRWRVARTPG